MKGEFILKKREKIQNPLLIKKPIKKDKKNQEKN